MKKEEQKSLLMYSLVIPGLIIIGSAIFLFNRDYSTLVRAEQDLSNRVNRTNRRLDNRSQRRLNLAFHRAQAQRISVVTDQIWGLVGGIVTAIGVHGIVTSMDSKSDSKSSGGERR